MGSASILARSFPTVRECSLRLAAVFAKRRRCAMGWRSVRPGKSRFHSLSVCVRKRLPTEIQTTNMSESCDSAWPVFWNQRMPPGRWTLHAVPAALCSFIKRRRRRGTVLISGCGTDHEVLQFFKPPVSKSPRSIFQLLPSPKPEKRWGISRAKLFVEIFQVRFPTAFSSDL